MVRVEIRDYPGENYSIYKVMYADSYDKALDAVVFNLKKIPDTYTVTSHRVIVHARGHTTEVEYSFKVTRGEYLRG